MIAKVLLLIDDEELRAKLTSYLASDRFAVSSGPSLKSSAHVEKTIAHIASVSPNLVIMDYQSEDEASVKVLQYFTDQERRTDFIFVDSYLLADREKIMLAFNEGVGAFLSPDISAVGLVNYVTRVVNGSSRLRVGLGEDEELESQQSRDNSSRIRNRLDNAQKLIAYLLSTPLTAQPRKTLILSDSAYQRELLKKYLEDHNFIVLTSAKFEDAVTVALTEKPRVVISDYTLDDGKTGVDFCHTLKFVHKFTPCYFVVCTANMAKYHVILTPGNGVDDCVLKPSPTSQLNEFLASVSAGLLL
jgi:DNA-binding NarL/FixJ family response regulator